MSHAFHKMAQFIRPHAHSHWGETFLVPSRRLQIYLQLTVKPEEASRHPQGYKCPKMQGLLQGVYETQFDPSF